MPKPTGGPAFPMPPTRTELGNGEALISSGHEGMSLRDYFAAQVLNGLLSDGMGQAALSLVEKGEADSISGYLAECAYGYADAMLAEREKNS